MKSHFFDLDALSRKEVISYLLDILEEYYQNTDSYRVTPELNPNEVRGYINKVNLAIPTDFENAIDHIIGGLKAYAVHTPHPRYFGLFNPRSNFASILADLITATFNPQMAAWSHNPFANEVEARCVRDVAARFGYDPASADGVFGGGGAEANITAVQCALVHAIPGYVINGVLSVPGQPKIYCTEETHHSILRGAVVSGLGISSIRTVRKKEGDAMDENDLSLCLENDVKEGALPIMVVSTAGTTGPGSLDNIEEIRKICDKYNVWLHVDAAFGGGLALSPKYRHYLQGIEKSDSITFDIHKWMSVPMAASMFITNHETILDKTFRLDADYMPKEAASLGVIDPFSHSIQWSRRFTGLKLYASLLFFGWEGYEQVIDHHMEMGDYLRDSLSQNDWEVVNHSVLPIACFTDRHWLNHSSTVQEFCDQVLDTGKVWISTYQLGNILTLRACITNYATTTEDINELIAVLNQVRQEMRTH